MLRFFGLFFRSLIRTVRARWIRGPARPSWSFMFETIVGWLRSDWDDVAGWSFERLRADMNARPYPQAMVARVSSRTGDLGGVPVRWFIPRTASDAATAVVLYFHGGSYIYGSSNTTHADVIARLAIASGVPVIGVEYRLAPEDPYPAALEDAISAFDALVASGTPASRIVLAGDSAGGNLAVALQTRLRDRRGPQAAGALLVSPWSDLTMPGRSFVDNDPYDIGTRDVLATHARAFAADVPLDDPRLSPVKANLRGLAPTMVIAGEVEIPRDDILAFADALERAGVEVTRHVAPDMPHNPPMFAAYHPSGAAAVEAAARFLRRFR